MVLPSMISSVEWETAISAIGQKQNSFGKLTMVENIYKALSEERKQLQEQGLVPMWYSTSGYQMFKEKYEYETNGRSVRGQFERIAKTAAKNRKASERAKARKATRDGAKTPRNNG